MLSLITDPWLPVRFRDGSVKRVRPIDILEEEIIDLAWPRADFQGAGYQFLIGLFQAAIPVKSQNKWQTRWEEGLDKPQIAAQFEQLAPAFYFGEKRPSFMQDKQPLAGDPLSIANLLLDSPAIETLTKNQDHFVKRGVVTQMCPCCAAMALFTLQVNAPTGGSGHRTGLRGGGPITTLVWPRDLQAPLWRRIWLNVLPERQMAAIEQANAEVFPWLGDTRTSEKAANITTPETDAIHPQQVYWAMPRRIEIDFSTPETGECSLCGEPSEQLLSYYRAKNHGVNYDNWIHPLSAYQPDRKDPTAPQLSVKGQKGGLLYKDWLGLLWRFESEKNSEIPAAVVRACPADIEVGIHCFGFDFDKMKARCWYQHQLPFLHLTERQRELLPERLHDAVSAAKEGLSYLKSAVKKVWYRRPKDAKGDFDFIDIAFWQETESQFIALIQQLAEQVIDPDSGLSALGEWRHYLINQLMQRFDDVVFASTDLPADLKEALIARKTLNSQLIKAFRPLAKFSSNKKVN